MDLLADLTPAQHAAVTHLEGPLLVLAGAGSGKTRVVTRRVAHLCAQGIAPHQILALTFTNKAAGEMRERVESLVGECRGLTLTTFHSFGARVLRRELPEPDDGAADPAAEVIAGRTRDFTIYDRGDQVAVVRDLLRTHAADDRVRPEGVLHVIGQVRAGHGDFGKLARGGPVERAAAAVGPRYEERLRAANAFDFDDLLLRPLGLIRTDPGRLARYRARFRHVLVDEYQDTNRVQYELLLLLTREHRNLHATGDPDQNIYGFRGADLRNILEFEADFPEAQVVALEQNYRSTKRILAAASALIRHNQRRREKGLQTDNDEGAPLQLCVGHDAERWREEAEARWSDAAVFYRTNAQSRAVEDALRLAGIPYQIVGGVEFFQRKEIKDATAYLRCAQNPRDRANFQRIVSAPPRGIGQKSVEALVAWSDRTGAPVVESLARAAEAGLRGKAAGAQALHEVLAAVRSAGAASAEGAARAALEHSGLLDAWRRDTDLRAPERVENLQELAAAAAEYDAREREGGLAGFLESIALIADVDGLDDDVDRVTLMTLHSSKGLEFPFVAIVGLEEELLPHGLAGGTPDGIEEERRLCFVGMTRAKRQLVLARARSRRR